VNICARHCSHVHYVQHESDLRLEWFLAADRVGITAGTSTPDDVIHRIEQNIRARAHDRDANAIAMHTRD